jgi:hypothetical protein
VTITGEPGAVLDSSSLLRSDEGDTLTIRNIELRATRGSNAKVLIATEGSTLIVDRSTIGPASDVCILTQAASTLRISRSVVRGCEGGGMQLVGVDFEVTNSFIVNNGSANGQFGGAQLQGAGRFEHNSVAGNLGNVSGVRCTVAVQLLRSIVFGNAGTNVNASCSATASIIEGRAGAVDPLFVNVAGGDLHLQASSPAINAATGSALTIDIDGQSRPLGGVADIGADERQ